MIARITSAASTLTAAALLLSLHSHAYGLEIYSDANDGFLEVRDVLPPQSPWPVVHSDTFGGWSANVGEWFGPGLTTIVLPFQLPNLGAASSPFTSANLGVMVHTIGTGPTTTDIDLYAVRTDADPAILASDWYVGSATDPSATLIQESFLTPASASGFAGAPNNSSDAAGDANLLAYLNASYDSGAGAGDFVFLRLNYAGDDFATVWDGYGITMREAGQQGEWPVLSVQTNAVSGDTDGDGIVELDDDFNPIRDNWLETNLSFGMQLARTDGDLDLDGLVGITDFREWKDAYLSIGGSVADVTVAAASLGLAPVPEPFSLLLAGIGSVAFAVRRVRSA